MDTLVIYVVSVVEHKTTQRGPAKLMFNPEMHSRALKYRELIRPLLTVTRGDVPFFFVLPNSQPIDKITNVARILQRRLGIDIPTATMVRKMGATAVARNCSEKEQHLVARQMNHDMQTCRDHYQAVVSDKDAVSMYTTIRHLREIPVTTDHETDPVTEEPSKTTRVSH